MATTATMPAAIARNPPKAAVDIPIALARPSKPNDAAAATSPKEVKPPAADIAPIRSFIANNNLANNNSNKQIFVI